MQKIIARSSARIIAPSPGSSPGSMVSSPNTWVTVSWSISVIRKRMRTTPSGQSGRGWTQSPLLAGSTSNPPTSRVHVGIATGIVIVGDLIGEGSAQEQSVVGETPNLAARLRAPTEPDAVVISQGTRRLVGDLFEYRDLGAVEVKGITAPVPAWQVLRPSVVASRFEALRGLVKTRLVGRDEEIDLLLRRWARAKAGDGQVVLVSGEPGLGKSRIAAALAERLLPEPHLRLQYFCSPYHQDSALFPFIDQLGRASEFARDDPTPARFEKLEALLARTCTTTRGCGTAGPSNVIANFGSATLCRTSVRNERRSGHWRRFSDSSKVWRAGSRWSWSSRTRIGSTRPRAKSSTLPSSMSAACRCC